MAPHLDKLGIKPIPMITAWDIHEMRRFWSNETQVDAFVDKAVREAVKNGFYGYNIDFEPVNGSSRYDAEGFTAFVQKFNDKLKEHKKYLSVDVARWSKMWNYLAVA